MENSQNTECSQKMENSQNTEGNRNIENPQNTENFQTAGNTQEEKALESEKQGIGDIIKELVTKKRKVLVIGACLLAVLIIAIVSIVQVQKKKKWQERYEQLAESTSVEETAAEKESEPSSSVPQETAAVVEEKREKTDKEKYEDSVKELKEMGIPIPEKEVDFDSLKAEVNKDIYAWIYIPNTLVDYPVLQHPEDNLYYLDYNIDGTKGYPGCIYTENYNSKDFTDPVTVMYGHNMKNGTMFANLHNFEDKDFFDNNLYIYVYTPDRLFVYEIYSAYLADDSHIILSNDFSNKDVLQNFIDSCKTTWKNTANVRDGLEVDAQDHILTLSTCAAVSTTRYLVNGVLLNEELIEE